MTRFKKTGSREYTASPGPKSKRHMRIMKWMQDHNLVSASSPDSVIVKCAFCGELVFGREWDHGKICKKVE